MGVFGDNLKNGSAMARVAGLVFSMDRALQLDCALRSFLLHCKDHKSVKLFVIFKTTSELHALQYAQLKLDYRHNNLIIFVEEAQFQRQVLGVPWRWQIFWFLRPFVVMILGLCEKGGYSASKLWGWFFAEYLVFMVDDNVFVSDFRMGDVVHALKTHPETLGFSLRLGVNTTWSYALNRAQPLPAFEQAAQGVLKYRWVNAEADFAYPLEVSSSVYRTSDLVPVLERVKFNNPNTLEDELHLRIGLFAESRPSLLCCEQSVAFSTPINKVQKTHNNRAGEDSRRDSVRLANLFDEGFRINVESFNSLVPTSCHMEVELAFEKKGVA